MNPEFWPEYVIAIFLMLMGSFFMAIPLSIVTRHFGASYDKITLNQFVRRKALKSFANSHRKSSAFVISTTAQQMTRRLSQISRRGSIFAVVDSDEAASVNKDSVLENDQKDPKRSVELTEVPKQTVDNEISDHFKLELKIESSKKKEVIDTWKLSTEYQVRKSIRKFCSPNFSSLLFHRLEQNKFCSHFYPCRSQFWTKKPKSLFGNPFVSQCEFCQNRLRLLHCE